MILGSDGTAHQHIDICTHMMYFILVVYMAFTLELSIECAVCKLNIYTSHVLIADMCRLNVWMKSDHTYTQMAGKGHRECM